MKLLFDQNLSFQLATRLADIFPHSVGVRRVNLDLAMDRQIWDYAQAHGFAIVSQDADFAERSRLQGSPPKIVWLRCGNATTAEVEDVIRLHAVLIMELEQDPALHWVELF